LDTGFVTGLGVVLLMYPGFLPFLAFFFFSSSNRFFSAAIAFSLRRLITNLKM